MLIAFTAKGKQIMTTLISSSASQLFQDSMVYRPFHYPWADQLFNDHEKIHWVPEEAELSEDANDWAYNLTDDERKYVKNILSIFTTGDIVVAKNYRDCFLRVVKNNEVSNWLMSVANREGTHQRAYSMANDIFGFGDDIFTTFEGVKEMRERLEGMFVDNNTDTVEQLALNVAHTIFDEGVSLFGTFIGLLQFLRRDIPSHNGLKGRLKSFGKINAWSLRDETMHTDGGVLLFNTIIAEHPHIVTDKFKRDIYELSRKMVHLEDEFLDVTFRELHMTTFTPQEAKAYIRWIMDRRLQQMGLKANYNIGDNPAPWIETILTENKISSFFETKVSNYQVAGAFVGTLDMSRVLNIPR